MTVLEDIKDTLRETHSGRKLGGHIITLVAKYLVEVVKVEDVNELDKARLKTTAAEAWAHENDGASLPGHYESQIDEWLSPKPIRTTSYARSVDGGDDMEDDVDDATLLCMEQPTARDLALLEQDKQAQGLSGARIVGLNASLELGRVSAIGNVVGVLAYKGDARLSDLAKQQRKAGMPTLSKILEGSHVRRELQTHFGNLIRDYSEMGNIQEASLITRWWAEAQTVSSDDKTLAEYIRQYFRKYTGRGIPEFLDVVVATRVTGERALSGVTADQLKEVLAVAKAAKSDAAGLQRELASLKAEVTRLKSNKPGKDKSELGPQCHKCGEFGHIARNCTNKDKKTSDDDAAPATDE